MRKIIYPLLVVLLYSCAQPHTQVQAEKETPISTDHAAYYSILSEYAAQISNSMENELRMKSLRKERDEKVLQLQKKVGTLSDIRGELVQLSQRELMSNGAKKRVVSGRVSLLHPDNSAYPTLEFQNLFLDSKADKDPLYQSFLQVDKGDNVFIDFAFILDGGKIKNIDVLSALPGLDGAHPWQGVEIKRISKSPKDSTLMD